MTTIATSPSPLSTRRLEDRLKQMHRDWLANLRVAVERVDAKDSVVWARWKAIRYVDTVFSAQFERERRVVVEGLSPAIDEDQVTPLWVAGELVALVRWQLRHLVGLCHHGAEYSAVTAKLLTAVDHWFAAVEEAVAAASWEAVPSRVGQDLASLGTETTPV